MKHQNLSVIVATDSFKESLSAKEVTSLISDILKKNLPQTTVYQIPMADGGEGTLEAIEQHGHYQRIELQVNNPIFQPIDTYYFIKEKTAYIELAKASGLELLKKENRNPLYTTTYGTGEQIFDAIKRNCSKIFLFLGGSATNDAGIGILQALGFRFLNTENKELSPTGNSLVDIKKIISTETTKILQNISFELVCDVNNPFYGRNGAAYIFAAQKGATESEIEFLDSGMKNFANLIYNNYNIDLQTTKHSGAAGGAAGGCMALLNCKIMSGAKFILQETGFSSIIPNANIVISGEGKIDNQTFNGKLLSEIIFQCKTFHKQFWCICGFSKLKNNELKSLGINKLYTLAKNESEINFAIENVRTLLQKETENIVADIKEIFNF